MASGEPGGPSAGWCGCLIRKRGVGIAVCGGLGAGKARILPPGRGPGASERIFFEMKDHDGDKTGLPTLDRRAGKAYLTLEADCAPERNFLCQPDGSALPAPARKNPLHSLPERRTLISREGMDRIPQNLSYFPGSWPIGQHRPRGPG